MKGVSEMALKTTRRGIRAIFPMNSPTYGVIRLSIAYAYRHEFKRRRSFLFVRNGLVTAWLPFRKPQSQ
jgi:hypothetical protein